MPARKYLRSPRLPAGRVSHLIRFSLNDLEALHDVESISRRSPRLSSRNSSRRHVRMFGPGEGEK